LSIYSEKQNKRDGTSQRSNPETVLDAYGRKPAEKYVSIPLYVGGAIAQISSLMAVAYQIADPTWTFAWFTILLSLIGLGTSYTLRRIGAPVRLMKMGGILLAVIFIYALRNGGVFGAIVPAEVLGSQEMLLVSALAFTATFCSFLLITDESVVFTCVWAIAIIGLTGTVNINRELIICFIIFLLAASFLLVHQNALSSGIDAFGYRRKKQTANQASTDDEIASAFQELEAGTSRPRTILEPRTVRPRWILLKTQLTMAAAAWFAAIIIGFVVAIPVQMIGRNLSLATIIQRLKVPAAASAVTHRILGKQVLNFESLRQFQVGLGPVDDDPTEKMTVISDRPSYWRGRIFDAWDGKSWLNTSTPPQSSFGGSSDPRAGVQLAPKENTPPSRDGFNVFEIPKNDPPRLKTIIQKNKFHINSGSFSPLYHAAEPIEVRAPATALFVRNDNTMGTRFVNGTDYEVTSEVSDVSPKDLRKSGRDYPREIRLQYLSSLSESETLRQLALEATEGVPNNPYDRAEAIRRFVGQRATYTLDARPVPANADAAEFFLTESKEGYCDLYATATTLLCRFAGIPARTVTGFAPGTPSEGNAHKFVLRGSDQHAWTEVYFSDYGWIPFDATQDTNGTIVTPRTPEPVKKPSLMEKLLAAGLLPTLLMITGILGVLYVLVSEVITRFLPNRRIGTFKRKPGKADVITALYIKVARQAARHASLAFEDSMTPGEFQREIRKRLGETVADAMTPLTRIVELASYGPQMVGDAEINKARTARQAVLTALRKVPRYHPPKEIRKENKENADAPVVTSR
jgi:transglutaminase-like putative cysteine protease